MARVNRCCKRLGSGWLQRRDSRTAKDHTSTAQQSAPKWSRPTLGRAEQHVEVGAEVRCDCTAMFWAISQFVIETVPSEM